jgi:signal transduction histidine kinase
VFSHLIAAMRRGETGTLVIGEEEATRLALGRADVVVAFTSVRSRGDGHWAIALFGSTSPLRAQERGIVLRLGLAAGAVALFLLAFGAYVVVASRRAVVARERLRHADHLAHLHEKTEKVLENVPTGVMVLADDGRITFVNRSLRERIPGQLVHGAFGMAFPRAPQAVVLRLRALVDEALSTERVESLIGERLGLFGEEAQYNVHAVPLERRFADARVVLVFEDLSEVRSLESQLVRAEKLATVGVLSAGIAHEIGTPLGVIRGRAEFVLSKLDAAHPHRSGLSTIVEQIDRVTRTIRQLLDFSRVSPPRVKPVGLPSLVESVRELLRYELTARKIELAVDVAADLRPLSADPDLAQQVLVNLIMNACDACEAGGTIRVEARLEEAPRWRRVRIEITDDGSGIPAGDQAQVFDPFFTTKKRGQGTGLGLPIAAQIVRNHGGEISLESAPGAGTRVIVRWPAAAEGQLHAVS